MSLPSHKIAGVTQLDIGCGGNKRAGFFGIDIIAFPGVDCTLNVEESPLPFPDDSIEYVYSSHTIEHLSCFEVLLRELLRVCKHDATIEIWTPYGADRESLLFGHKLCWTELQWFDICYWNDRNYLRNGHGYFKWNLAHYNLRPGITGQLERLNIPLLFALEHMTNIAFEWGVFLQVKKDLPRAPDTEIPVLQWAYGREHGAQVPLTQ
jgi:SAM-dependent methyltransferase